MDKPNAYIGVDPGAKGAFCLLVPSTKQVAFRDTTDKPMDLYAWFKRIEEEFNIRVMMIEDVHAIFGTSAKSNFSFGYNVGTVNTLAQVTGNTVDRVTPKKWQKYIGIKTKGKAIKKEVSEICERLYPQVNIRGARGGLLDGRSDALMVAHYAYHLYNEN